MQEELKQIRMSWINYELLEKLHLQIFVNFQGLGKIRISKKKKD